MSESMIDRVARAIYGKLCEIEGTQTTFDQMITMSDMKGYVTAKRLRHLVFEEARAAIAAMREPTCPMTVVGWKKADERAALLGNGEIAMIWHAMIDAALAEAGK